MGPMEVLHRRHGSEIHLSDREMSLRTSKHVSAYGWHFLDSQLVQTVLTKGFTGLWLPTHPLHLPHSPLVLPPLQRAITDITMVLTKVAQNPSVLLQIASRNIYKTLVKRLFQLYSVLAWLQSTTRELHWLHYLKSVFLKIPNVTTWSVFQNQVTYLAVSST